MPKRKETPPDIMSSLLSGKKDEPAPKPPTLTETRKPAPAVQETGEPESIKITVYLSEDTAYGLDEAKGSLRRLLKPDRARTITKSSIVEAALSLALQELQEKQEDSSLAKYLED
jgi:hypothetical protein